MSTSFKTLSTPFTASLTSSNSSSPLSNLAFTVSRYKMERYGADNRHLIQHSFKRSSDWVDSTFVFALSDSGTTLLSKSMHMFNKSLKYDLGSFGINVKELCGTSWRYMEQLLVVENRLYNSNKVIIRKLTWVGGASKESVPLDPYIDILCSEVSEPRRLWLSPE